MCTPNSHPKDELILDERGCFSPSLQGFFLQLRRIFPQLRWTIPMKKSYLLPFPSDFFHGYNEKTGFSTVTMEIPPSSSVEMSCLVSYLSCAPHFRLSNPAIITIPPNQPIWNLEGEYQNIDTNNTLILSLLWRSRQPEESATIILIIGRGKRHD